LRLSRTSFIAVVERVDRMVPHAQRSL
jgi:hypothetical protein